MTCNHCGNQLPDGTAFCPNCGTRLLTTPRPNTAARLRKQTPPQKDPTPPADQGAPVEQSTQLLPVDKVRAAQAAQDAALNAGVPAPTPTKTKKLKAGKAPKAPKAEDDAPKFKAKGGWKIVVLIVLIVALLGAGGYIGYRWWKNRGSEDDAKNTTQATQAAPTPTTTTEPTTALPPRRASEKALFDYCIEALNPATEPDDEYKQNTLKKEDCVDAAFYVDYYSRRNQIPCNPVDYDVYRNKIGVTVAYFDGGNYTVEEPDGSSATYDFKDGNKSQLPLTATKIEDAMDDFKDFAPQVEDAKTMVAHSEKMADGNTANIRITLVKIGGEWKIFEIIPEGLNSYQTGTTPATEPSAPKAPAQFSKTENSPDTSEATDSDSWAEHGPDEEENIVG
ncbi:MAG: zinc-ribbon domain-containing protein [Clostridia bacterium]|nr:zinc-ribbon domain-containing protein [Clostridia bacterium]